MAEVPSRGRPSNLPLPLTGFVGRQAELVDVQLAVAEARIVTLTGPGGVGKTRLALEVASAAIERFPDGAWWVEVAPLCDPGLVPHAVALALGVSEDPALSSDTTLKHYLQPKDLLLVLDNCEHLVAACAELAAHLLQSCPRLHVLATSREPLGVAGEIAWTLSPLSLPCLDEKLTLDTLAESEAGQLFLQRARAADPGFQPTEEGARAIGQVCCRLDGLPLAIELAAAKVRVLSVSQIAAHLDDRFRLLTGGLRTELPHHQTLKAAIDWSYDLLPAPEQRLFERLSVFAGGFSLQAAQAVAGDPAAPVYVLDLLSRLVLKSLIETEDQEQVRYHLLETIRQYAWDRLQAGGDLEQTRHRHLSYYLELAQSASQQLAGTGQLPGLRALEAEIDNLRTALAWSRDGVAPELGLRLATSLAPFWRRAGYLLEGSEWLDRALAACPEESAVRIEALNQAGRLALQRGDYAQAAASARSCLALSHQLGDRSGIARAQGLLGWVAHWQGDRDTAGTALEEALSVARDAADERAVARTLLVLGDLRLRQGALASATALLRESLELYERMGDAWSTAWALGALGDVARMEGDFRRAQAHSRLSLTLYRELHSTPEIPYSLEALALTSADQGDLARAARLMGAASSLRDSIHARLPPSYEADYAPTLRRLRTELGEESFEAAWAEGRAMTLDQALALVEVEPPGPTPSTPGSGAVRTGGPTAARPYGLTPREVEVLRLVANGLSDAQVAERLVISPRTVGKHLESIYSKLYLPSRSAATRWAIEHNLA